MTTENQSIMTPVGRLVSGSVSDANLVKDDNGNPKLDKAGQQMHEFYIGVAIPKDGSGQHWAHTDWGAVLWAVGHGSFPGGQAQAPTFAWKVIDGDSAVPNQRGVAPNTRDGFPGHWILSFKTSFVPQMVNANGTQAIAPTELYRGCYVQVLASVKGNASTQSPGIFLNQQIVALAGHGERINTGPDAATAGFGQAALPQGASQQPLANNFAAQVPGAQPPANTAPPVGHPAQAMPPQGQAAPQPAAAQPPQQAAPAPSAPPPADGAPQQPYPQAMTPPTPPAS